MIQRFAGQRFGKLMAIEPAARSEKREKQI